MPTSPLREFEYKLYNLLPKDRVELIDSKLEHQHKWKSNGDEDHITNYYIQEFNNMKKNVNIYSYKSPLSYLFDKLMYNNKDP